MIKIIGLVLASLIDYDNTQKRIKKLDMEYKSIKSDDWKRKNGLLK